MAAPGDPFEGFQFDEEWAASASKREPAAEDRAIRARQARAAFEAAERERRVERRGHRRRRQFGGWSRQLPALLFVAVLAGWAWNVRSGGSSGAQPVWLSGRPVVQRAGPERPTPAGPVSSTRLRLLPPAPEGSGSYEFLRTQRGTAEPVTYDPCRPIRWVLNPRTAPPGADRLVADAVTRMSQLSGLVFEVEGITDEIPLEDRAPFQRSRYGDRWAPVLLAWSDPAELPVLEGRVAGIGGSTSVLNGDGREVFVSGLVVLDGPQFGSILDEDDGAARARAIIEHELGHLLGLAHVEDDAELMHPGGTEITGPGTGDRMGLYLLGSGRCVDRL